MSRQALTTFPQLTMGRTRTTLQILLVATFALRVIALDRLGLAYDEAASALMARASPEEIIAFHWNAAFEHPPLWALILHSWTLVAGQSEFALRVIPAFAGTLIVAMTWRLVRAIWPDEPMLSFLSALYVALAPVLIYYSQEARMYTLVVLLMLASTYLILQIRVMPNWLSLFVYWLATWVMLGLHYYSALALVIQAGVIGMDGLLTDQRRRLPWFMLTFAFAGAMLPVIVWMLNSPGFQTTLEVVLVKAGENPVSWHYFLGDLWRELTFGSIRWQPPYAEWGYAIAPLVITGALLVILRPARDTLRRVGAWCIIAVVVLPIVSGTLELRTLVPRYILWVVPLFYTLSALPAARLWRRNRLAASVLVLLVIGVDLLALQHYFGPYRKSEYREMVAYLTSQGDPNKEILLLEAPRQHLLTKYYLPDRWQAHPMPTIELRPYWPVTAPPLVPEDEDDRVQAWLSQYAGLWVSYTSEAEVDRGEFLAKYLTAVSYREHCTQWLDVRLCHYISPHHIDPIEFEVTPTLFGNELALTRAQGTKYQRSAEATSLLIQLDWLAQQKPTVDYKIALRLLDANGNTVDEANDFPIGPLLPPTTWNAGDAKPGYFTLRLPTTRVREDYRVELILYDANSFAAIERVPLEEPFAAGTPTTEPVTLAELRVGDTIELLLPIEP